MSIYNKYYVLPVVKEIETIQGEVVRSISFGIFIDETPEPISTFTEESAAQEQADKANRGHIARMRILGTLLDG